MKHANMSDASEAITREGGEILFSTPFDYLFPEAARDPASVLPPEPRVIDALLELGASIADPGPGNPAATPEAFDSNIPAGFTYLGQFIDHDITARTDRELADIGSQIVERPLRALSPDLVIQRLRNGRRPELDLDAVYGDGPALIPNVQTVASPLFEPDLSMRLETAQTFDLPRYDGEAVIADIRNDENVMISQMHATIIALHNRIASNLNGSDPERYIRARQLTRWAYQSVVLHDYL